MRKSALSLEPVPSVTRDLQKGKGIVFGYSTADTSSQIRSAIPAENKLMAAAIKANPVNSRKPEPKALVEGYTSESQSTSSSSSLCGSTGHKLDFKSNFPGTKTNKLRIRNRPGKSKRKSKTSAIEEDNISISLEDGMLIGCLEKRKAEDQMGRVPKAAKKTTQEVVPHEGRPNA